MAEPAVIVEKEGHVLVVTLNRPDKRNAVNAEVMCRLYDAWVMLDADDTLRVAILTGNGNTFCAGMDLSEISKLGEPDPESPWIRRLQKEPEVVYGAWLKTYRPTKPIILAAEGFARAGGTEILQGTDIRIASESAMFGVTEVQRGLFPMAGSAVRLRRQIGYAVAAEMLLVGEDLPARRAHELGLVNHVVPDGQTLQKAREIAERRAQRPARGEGHPREAARDGDDGRSGGVRGRTALRRARHAVGGRRRGAARVPREARTGLQGTLSGVPVIPAGSRRRPRGRCTRALRWERTVA